jgi:hypothetical protein
VISNNGNRDSEGAEPDWNTLRRYGERQLRHRRIPTDTARELVGDAIAITFKAHRDGKLETTAKQFFQGVLRNLTAGHWRKRAVQRKYAGEQIPLEDCDERHLVDPRSSAWPLTPHVVSCVARVPQVRDALVERGIPLEKVEATVRAMFDSDYAALNELFDEPKQADNLRQWKRRAIVAIHEALGVANDQS